MKHLKTFESFLIENDNINFKKEYDPEIDSSIYTAFVNGNKIELYQERTYKRNGTSKNDGDWLLQINGKIAKSFSTLKKAQIAVKLFSL